MWKTLFELTNCCSSSCSEPSALSLSSSSPGLCCPRTPCPLAAASHSTPASGRSTVTCEWTCPASLAASPDPPVSPDYIIILWVTISPSEYFLRWFKNLLFKTYTTDLRDKIYYLDLFDYYLPSLYWVIKNILNL